jgi:arylsulfatase A-like enzyme
MKFSEQVCYAQGWNDLGFVNPLMLTPQIDRLATTDGLLLTHFYTAKECAPTRGALMVP